MIKVSIVEDETSFADLVERTLLQHGDFHVAGKHRTGEAALLEIPKQCPDVVLMDISLPGMNGIECLQRLKDCSPSHVLILTCCEDPERVFESLKAGAEGYIEKRDLLLPSVAEAIRDVMAGGGVLTPFAARKVINYFRQKASESPQNGTASQTDLDILSPREVEVLRELTFGLMYKEIASKISISMDTVRKHIGSIYRKLHVRSRTEATRYYLERERAR